MNNNLSSKNILTIQTVQIAPFRTLMTALKDILLETNITFSKEGIKIINMDKSHTILAHLSLLATNFEVYDCKMDKIIIGVNMFHLFKLINTIDNDDTLTIYIENILPAALENDDVLHKQREERKQKLINNRDEFTTRFLNINKYFYAVQAELFLLYDGTHFNMYSEDNIQHQIMSTITNEQNLMDWKRKIKNNIIKRIKETSPLNAIPESNTIQFVINMIYPSIFQSRNTAKYFLTIIGDCLNTKMENNFVYLISPLIKNIINEISNQYNTYFGVSNSLHNIKYKYYDHHYEKCRLVQINTMQINTTDKNKAMPIPPNLIKYMIDFLCVCSHYSARYGNADGFLKKCSETKLVEHAFYLYKNPLDGIVDKFIEKTIKSCPSSKIDNKNMLFLWKKFLDEKNIPNITFHENLKTIFKNKLKYDEVTDQYLDVTSVHIPFVAHFMKFWSTTMSEDSYDEEPEIEIDELTTLFKGWLAKTKNIMNMNINEGVLIELIRHFYPEVVIEEDKYLIHIKCNLWNKRLEIVNSLYLFKLKCNGENELFTKSLYEAYAYYSLNNKHTCLASKRYFEKIAADIISGHIDTDGLISPTWWK